MSQLRINLTDEKSAFEPREELTGSASWQLDRSTRNLELRLFWFTRGRGIEDAALVQTVRFENPLNEETRSFSFRLPDAPYSFVGQLISLVWALELIVEPSKELARQEIIVAPGCQEVRLGSIAPQSGKITTSITWQS
jgi:hypothetical protein